MTDPATITPEVADRIYSILVDECGAAEHDRQHFIQVQTVEHIREWRFCGKLGFGGKFWRCNGCWYVNCYPEHETPERVAMIEAANRRLAASTAGGIYFNSEAI